MVTFFNIKTSKTNFKRQYNTPHVLSLLSNIAEYFFSFFQISSSLNGMKKTSPAPPWKKNFYDPPLAKIFMTPLQLQKACSPMLQSIFSLFFSLSMVWKKPLFTKGEKCSFDLKTFWIRINGHENIRVFSTFGILLNGKTTLEDEKNGSQGKRPDICVRSTFNRIKNE